MPARADEVWSDRIFVKLVSIWELGMHRGLDDSMIRAPVA